MLAANRLIGNAAPEDAGGPGSAHGGLRPRRGPDHPVGYQKITTAPEDFDLCEVCSSAHLKRGKAAERQRYRKEREQEELDDDFEREESHDDE
jgi:hypothetical protein